MRRCMGNVDRWYGTNNDYFQFPFTSRACTYSNWILLSILSIVQWWWKRKSTWRQSQWVTLPHPPAIIQRSTRSIVNFYYLICVEWNSQGERRRKWSACIHRCVTTVCDRRPERNQSRPISTAIQAPCSCAHNGRCLERPVFASVLPLFVHSFGQIIGDSVLVSNKCAAPNWNLLKIETNSLIIYLLKCPLSTESNRKRIDRNTYLSNRLHYSSSFL